MNVGLLVVIVMLAAAAVAIFWPLRTHHKLRRVESPDAALIVARDAKLGELSDLELDFRLGKLSDEDYSDLNAALRTEAVEIMRQIDDSNSHTNGTRPERTGR